MLTCTTLNLSPTQFKGWINTANTQPCRFQITGLVGTAGLHHRVRMQGKEKLQFHVLLFRSCMLKAEKGKSLMTITVTALYQEAITELSEVTLPECLILF